MAHRHSHMIYIILPLNGQLNDTICQLSDGLVTKLTRYKVDKFDIFHSEFVIWYMVSPLFIHRI